MHYAKLKDLLEQKVEQYNTRGFIDLDPVSIPHHFQKKEDREISGFLAASIAWGQRPTIIRNALRMLELMDHAPFDFVYNHQPQDLQRFQGFVHRTFNYDDLVYFISSLKDIYRNHGGLERAFAAKIPETNTKDAISRFRALFFSQEHLRRTEKHVSDPYKNSACKRLNMFLRWMVRKDKKGVDFGIWDSLQARQLSCPLDVHSGNVARKLGLLHRKQNNWKAVEELDHSLRQMDGNDPVKYDFALFGMGVFEKLK